MACWEVSGCVGSKVWRHIGHGGGECREVFSSKGDDILWFSQQQKLQEVSQQGSQLRMVTHVCGMVALNFLLIDKTLKD